MTARAHDDGGVGRSLANNVIVDLPYLALFQQLQRL
jgi:hypothetical protein